MMSLHFSKQYSRLVFFHYILMIFCLDHLVIAQEKSQKTLPFPLGIADSSTGRAYFRADNSIIAIRLSDGAPLWSFLGGFMPLYINDNNLVVLARSTSNTSLGLAIATINIANGHLIAQPKALRISESQAKYLTSLQSSPQITKVDDYVLVSLPSSGRYSGGANPPFTAIQPNSDSRPLVLRIQPDSGEATIDSSAKDADAIAMRSNDNHPLRNITSLTYSLAYTGKKIQLLEIDRAGKKFLAIEIQSSPSPTVICPVADLRGPTYATDDGAYLFIQKLSQSKGVPTISLFSIAAMRIIGEFTGSIDDNNISVIDDRAFWIAKPADGADWQLISVNLAKAVKTWSFAIPPRQLKTNRNLPQ